jgi:hypothetical protein
MEKRCYEVLEAYSKKVQIARRVSDGTLHWMMLSVPVMFDV